MTARSGDLISKEFDDPLVNPVVVRLYDTLAVFVTEAKQAFPLNRSPDDRIDIQDSFRRYGPSPPRLFLGTRSCPVRRERRECAVRGPHPPEGGEQLRMC